MLNANYLLKAEKRLETAKFALEKGYICSAVSNCYYALFNLMQAVVGEAEKKRWEHGGLPKRFTKVCIEKSFLSRERLKGFVEFVDELYLLRRLADYSNKILAESEIVSKYVEHYITRVEDTMKALKEVSND